MINSRGSRPPINSTMVDRRIVDDGRRIVGEHRGRSLSRALPRSRAATAAIPAAHRCESRSTLAVLTAKQGRTDVAAAEDADLDTLTTAAPGEFGNYVVEVPAAENRSSRRTPSDRHRALAQPSRNWAALTIQDPVPTGICNSLSWRLEVSDTGVATAVTDDDHRTVRPDSGRPHTRRVHTTSPGSGSPSRLACTR